MLLVCHTCAYATTQAETIFFDDFAGGSGNFSIELPGAALELHSYGGAVSIRGTGEQPQEDPAGRFAWGWIELSAVGGYRPILQKCQAPIRWSFAFRHDGRATSLSGVGDGAGVVLAASTLDFRTDGVGYAVVKGGNQRENPALRFVKFKGGLAGEVTELASWSDSEEAPRLARLLNAPVRVRVEFNPLLSEWTVQAKIGSLLKPLNDSVEETHTRRIVDRDLVDDSLPFFGFFLSTGSAVGSFDVDSICIETVKP